ncbi:MAG: DUF2953 domain-containing protein [Vallitaleaceae bacterium]|jgi:hypothetical protein|nr:DUF2953 domain-containing protein [Vallitaleaceae bacterium]
MLGVIGLILKIILYIILGILGVVLLLLSLVLFVPLRYLVNVNKMDDLEVRGKVSWLFGLIRFYFDVLEGNTYKVKVLIFTVKSSEKDIEDADKKTKTVKKTKKRKKTKMTKSAKTDRSKTKASIISDSNRTVIKEDAKEDAKDSINEARKEDVAKKVMHTGSNADKQPHKDPKTDFDNKSISKKQIDQKEKASESTKDKDKTNQGSLIESIKNSYNNIKSIWQDDAYKGVVKFVLGNVFKLLKSIKPRKIRADIVFGTGDPATTGYIIGGISVFYGITDGHIVVIPDFLEKTFSGTIMVKGRVFLFVLLYYGIRTYLDKRVRMVIKKFS